MSMLPRLITRTRHALSNGSLIQHQTPTFRCPPSMLRRFSSAKIDARSEETKALDNMKTLAAEIKRHSDAYYNQAKSEISDVEYDSLVDRLRSLEQQYPLIQLTDSPTRSVGIQPRGDHLYKHKIQMLSLDNTYSRDELFQFEQRNRKILFNRDHDTPTIEYVCELKYDGIAVSLLYEKGEFKRALSRGDGLIGEDITKNVRLTVKSLPLSIPEYRDRDVEIRGELVISKRKFAEMNEGRKREGLPPFKNPRNLVAGLMRLDLEDEKKKKAKESSYSIIGQIDLDMISYTLLFRDASSTTETNAMATTPTLNTHTSRLSQLESMGFQPDPQSTLCHDLTQVYAFLDKWERERGEYDWTLDGIVIKVNDIGYQRILSEKVNAPRWAIAYKYSAERGITMLKSITSQVGRTGKVTPVGEIEPVILNGATISRATLNNFDYIINLGIRPGEKVIVERGGEVIPKIVGLQCTTTPPEGKVDHYCTNVDCPNTLFGRYLHFVSKTAMDIEGLGEKTISALQKVDLLSSVVDIYRLREHRETLLKLEGWKDKKTDNLLAAIEESKNRPLERVIHALGIPEVGEATAAVLVQNFSSLQELSTVDRQTLSNIESLGPVVSDAVYRYFQENHLWKELEDVGVTTKRTGDHPIRKRSTGGQLPLSGKTIVVTGKFSQGREKVEERLLDLGAKLVGTIGKKTDYVIVGEKPGTSKMNRCQELNITIVREDEIDHLISRLEK
ncbi:DNA ligase, NAD-dependent [Planoprotostelium fungivorum]|uniref:DNA ligase (NAD(+)) n=1 Tax=Planoprotostelium fungivorum TaxID=1890364 RepID=A0A2P6NP95_9EUKA|nr:DNA ligase, NAD-dependent [Planoprotostelium fungivorum]